MFPSEPCKKYEYLEKLKSNGLDKFAAMLTYKHGNNIGDIHFVWKVPDYSPEAFSRSLRTIEMAKENVLVFHTRTMRKALLAKYGRVAPAMKKSVMLKWYSFKNEVLFGKTSKKTLFQEYLKKNWCRLMSIYYAYQVA